MWRSGGNIQREIPDSRSFAAALSSTVTPVYKTQVFLPQIDSVTSRTSSKSPSKSPDLPTTPAIDPTNCSVEDIDVPKGINSSFTLTVRDSERQVVKEYSSNIKVEIPAVGKGIYEPVRGAT